MSTKNANDYENTQIIRRDAKNCFVEGKSFGFEIGKAVFEFAAYDLSKPQGSRYTNHVTCYIDIPEFLQFSHEVTSGFIHKRMSATKKILLDSSAKEEVKKEARFPLFHSMGGTTAERLSEPRADGMSVSRSMKLHTANKTDYLLTAESGPGKANEKGLIVPCYKTPEQKITVPLSWRALEQLLLMMTAHYQAWLVSQYISKPEKP